MQSNLKTMANGAGLVFIGMFLSKVLTYFWRVVVARIGPEEYGLLSLGIAVLGIATTLSLLGLSSGVLRYVSYYSGKKDSARIKGVITTALKISVPLSLVIAFLTYFFSETIAISIFHDVALIPVIKIIAFAIPLNVIATIFLSALRAFQKIKYEIFTKQIIESATRLIFTLISIYLGLNIFGLTFAYGLSIISTFIFSFYFLQKKVFPIFKTKIKSIFIYNELLNYSLPLVIVGFVSLIIMWTDVLMLGIYKNSEIVGIYNAALPTANLMLLFPTAILALFLPIITKNYAKKNIDSIKKTYMTATKWVFIANFPALILMIFFSKNILTILFGSNYAIGALPLSILSIGYFIMSIAQTNGTILNMYKKTKLLLKISIISALGNILLNALLIPTYGMIGGAIATSSAFITSAILVTYHAKKKIKINPYTLDMIKIFLIGSIMISLTYLLLHKIYTTIPIISATIMLLIFGVLYIIILIQTNTITKNEKEIISIIIKKIKNITKQN